VLVAVVDLQAHGGGASICGEDDSRDGDTLTGSASERTKLHFVKVKGDEPAYTAYREDHVFTFPLVGGDWLLADQRPAETNELAPITKLIDLVATGDPLLVDPDASAIERPTGKPPAPEGWGTPSGTTSGKGHPGWP
jgi:hypothetical protein